MSDQTNFPEHTSYSRIIFVLSIPFLIAWLRSLLHRHRQRRRVNVSSPSLEIIFDRYIGGCHFFTTQMSAAPRIMREMAPFVGPPPEVYQSRQSETNPTLLYLRP